MPEIVLIAHNIRSSHNVGSLLRTAEGLGVGKLWLTGYSPYPQRENDPRLPHLSHKLHRQIHKTALGAEDLMAWEHSSDVMAVIRQLRHDGYNLAALEQTAEAIALPRYTPPPRIAIVVGREAEGIEPEVLSVCDITLAIPMCGRKESFNVVQAAAMALYHLRFTSH